MRENVDTNQSGREYLLKLKTAILARFPKFRRCRIQTYPDLRKTFTVPALDSADVRIHVWRNEHEDCGGEVHGAIVTRSSWLRKSTRLPNRSERMSVAMTEPLESETDQFELSPHNHPDRDPAVRCQQLSQQLSKAHPTLAIHRELGEAFLNQCGDQSETGTLRYPWLAFETCDQYHPSMHLQEVTVALGHTTDGDRNAPAYRSAISLTRQQYEHRKISAESSWQGRRAFVALGSNIGDRITLIESACNEMNSRGLEIRRTSHLYETKPMYVEDQQFFINGVCEV